jgi:sporulation protein YlmC with PRC-barrel domain
MQVNLGDHVRTIDGKDVGKIDKLILDPVTNAVKAAVVRKGFFLPDDIEIPLGALERESDDTLLLKRTETEVDDLPRFYEASYTPPPPTYLAPFGYPGAAVLWPVGWPGGYPVPGQVATDTVAAEATEAQRRQDLDNAVLDEGSDVLARGGEKIGELQRVTFDSTSRRPASFVVRRGLITTEEIELPAASIASVDDRIVYLHLTKEEIEARFSQASS